MGLFDAFKKMTGGGKQTPPENVKGPTRTLKDAGVDTSCLDCKVNADGSLTVSGTVDSGAERDRVVGILEGMPNISSVNNEINVGEPEPEVTVDEPAPEAPAAESGSGETEEGRTYTVQSGDTLWKISQQMYGNGSKYMKIFEANTPMLENPDRIFPGQVLVIPDLEE
jgi:nucleoid-associated protein YgaU